MKLDEHIHRVAQRSRAFYAASEPGHFLVMVQIPTPAPPVPPLWDFDLDRELHRWLDFKLEAARPVWAAKEGLDDDSIPCIYPHFGVAEHSAWLGMDVQLQQVTCLPVPIVHSSADLDRLSLSTQTRWFRYMKEGYDYYRGRKDGTFVLGVRGTMTPMEMANAVRGDGFFEDVLVEKEFMHRLMAWLTVAIPWYYDQLLSWTDEVEDGRAFMFPGGWLPKRCLSHLSNDAAMLCGPDVYRELGLPYEKRLAAGYDGCVYHIHNQKMHFVPDAATLPGLMLMEITHDPRTTPPIEDLPRIYARTGSCNLMLHANSDQVRAHIAELRERNVVLDVSCGDRGDAEDIVRFVRSHSKPL